MLLGDPLGALVEKEVRFLTRSPRFRLVFLMGFTFGLLVWLPVAMGRQGGAQSFLGTNYLSVVSVYSLVLLSEACFWNSFGFDRSAAQIYFLAPVAFSRVLMGKNLSALFFIALEIGMIALVCGLLGMPLRPLTLAETFGVTAVITIFLLAAGNQLSIRQPRAMNPTASFRSGASGRAQAILFVVWPIVFVPVGLAYLARYAFASEAAFFGVLALDAAIGAVVYKLSLDSAVAAAEQLKEQMVTALSRGEGPITAYDSAGRAPRSSEARLRPAVWCRKRQDCASASSCGDLTSIARSFSLVVSPPPNPPSPPSPAITRWHGITIGIRFFPFAEPTARDALGFPTRLASSP